MCVTDWTAVLAAIGRAYPEPARLADLCSDAGLDGERVRSAVRNLGERGFLALEASSGREATALFSPRLTEAGMAVAFGLASVAEVASGAVPSLEAETLRRIGELRAGRSGGPARPKSHP